MPEIEALLAHRGKSGIDRRDEPARNAGLEVLMQEFNLGDPIDDYRIPDAGCLRQEPAWLTP